MKRYESASPEQTLQIGRQIAETLRGGQCLALIGGLGAGKTTLVRGLADGLGCDVGMVSSPTYVLVHEYAGRLPMYHIDVYRLGHPQAEFLDLGVEEMLAEGVVVIEWADRLGEVLPGDHLAVTIEVLGAETRAITLQPHGL
jgi:tRNA threonylcarbamoyladenosine biosynthesis protein TsaE